jgi:hypothetical protein
VTRRQIPNDKFQIPNKLKSSITETDFFEFGIWVIGAYLLFGAWDLVLLIALLYAP